MEKDEFNSNQRLQPVVNKMYHEPEGYPLYPEKEDIYTKFKKEKRIDPEAITQYKGTEIIGFSKEEIFNDDSTDREFIVDESESDGLSEYLEIDDEEIFYSALVENDKFIIEENPDVLE